MRQTFDETTDPSFGREHAPLIRAAMAAQGLDGFVIPHEDEHQNEYLPAANDRLAWATGFTGSAGAAVLLKDKAAIFVDGRYTLQVRDQVDTDLFEIRDLVEGGVPAYLQSEARAGWTIGYDPQAAQPRGAGAAEVRRRQGRRGAEAGRAPTRSTPPGARRGRPSRRRRSCPHPAEFAGEDSATKRERVGKSLAEQGADAALITSPSSIAWLFNIRGGDVIRSPLPLSQAILNADGTARLFLDPAKVTPDLPAWLGNGVTLEPPDALAGALADLAGRRVLVDPGPSSAWYFETLEKAGAERGARRRSHRPAPRLQERGRDRGRAPAPTSATARRWPASCTGSPPRRAETCRTSSTVVAKLEGFREATGALKDLSFDTIAGAGLERRHRPLPPDHAAGQAHWSAARCCWSTAARSTWTAPPTSPAPSPSARPSDGDAPSASPWC